MRNAWVIARREYNHYFSTTVSYSVALTILFVLGAIFFLVLNQAIQNAFNGGSTAGAAVAPDIKVIAVWFTIMSVLTVPALTMRLISDENRMGTLELLLTAPLQDWELIVGKWLGALLFLLTILAVTLVYPIILNIYETPGTNLQWQVLSSDHFVHCSYSHVLEPGYRRKTARFIHSIRHMDRCDHCGHTFI